MQYGCVPKTRSNPIDTRTRVKTPDWVDWKILMTLDQSNASYMHEIVSVLKTSIPKVWQETSIYSTTVKKKNQSIKIYITNLKYLHRQLHSTGV